MTVSGYSLDLSTFSLEEFKQRLKESNLLPSQQVLLDNIDERFACLAQRGIENLQQLRKALKSKLEIQSFAQATGLDANYLTIRRRMVNSYQAKPVNLKEFPELNPDVVHRLEQLGIKNTKQLFPHVLTPEQRRDFAKENQLELEDILELTKLTDVVRLRWIGPNTTVQQYIVKHKGNSLYFWAYC